MSSTTERRQQQDASAFPVGVDYVPTEEEKKVFQECNHESFLYRSVPFSMISIAVTQALLTKGTLVPSPRFGPLPKLLFAGLCGYMAGKISYTKVCQEKFKRLENSPLGEALRQRAGLSYVGKSEMSDPNKPSFDSMFQSADDLSQRDHRKLRSDDVSPPVEDMDDAEEPRRRGVLYEDLRLKNRENYEVTLPQRPDALLKTLPERESERPKRKIKNAYGDTWEE